MAGFYPVGCNGSVLNSPGKHLNAYQTSSQYEATLGSTGHIYTTQQHRDLSFLLKSCQYTAKKLIQLSKPELLPLPGTALCCASGKWQHRDCACDFMGFLKGSEEVSSRYNAPQGRLPTDRSANARRLTMLEELLYKTMAGNT